LAKFVVLQLRADGEKFMNLAIVWLTPWIGWMDGAACQPFSGLSLRSDQVD
jgi:hypothetical protein